MTTDLAAHAATLLEHTTIVRPDGPGPLPVVVQLHGCGGIQPMQMRYAETARAAGVAALVVDSLAPRGIGRREAQLTICTGLRLRGAERAVDLLAMLHWLRSQPWADPARIAVAGWSHGAWAIMDAMTGARPEANAPDLLSPIKL
ncbi:MAG: prolyl oligopeptidase family serine peptidase, partial [Caulobacteraceae bacterium]